eukprot:5487235-Ditylum_brightwellii.AAC.1
MQGQAHARNSNVVSSGREGIKSQTLGQYFFKDVNKFIERQLQQDEELIIIIDNGTEEEGSEIHNLSGKII